MESELNCSSCYDSPRCPAPSGVDRPAQSEDVLQALCTLSRMGVEPPGRSLSPVLCAVVWTLLSSGVLLAFCFLIFTLRFKNNRIVKMSSPNLNVLTLCGSVLTYISGFLFAIEERSHTQSGGGAKAVLQVRLWTLCIGSTLVFGPILGKTWRLYRVFTQRVPDKRVIIRDIQLMGLVGLLVLVDVLVLTVWSLTDPVRCARSTGAVVKVVEREVSYSLSQMDSCSSVYSDLWVTLLTVLKGSLLLYGTYLAGLTSNVSLPPVNQSPTIITAVGLVTLSVAVAMPVWRYLHAWPDLVYGVVGGAVFVCTLATNCLLFVPQLTQWRRFEEENNSPSQMARYFSSPSKSLASAYSQDHMCFLVGENTSMKRLLSEKDAAIDSLQEQVNNAKDKLLRLMSASHPRPDPEMDSSNTNLNSSSTQTTVAQSEGPPTPSPPPRDTDATLSPPLPLSSPPPPPPPSLSPPPLAPSPPSEGKREAGASDALSAGLTGGQSRPRPQTPPPQAPAQTAARSGTGPSAAGESEGGTRTAAVTPPSVHADASPHQAPPPPPWSAGFVSSEQLREVLWELSADAVSPGAARRGPSRRPSLSPLPPRGAPPLSRYPAISPYAMRRRRRPPFRSPRGGAPPCFYPGSEPPGWGRGGGGPPSSPPPHKPASKTQPDTVAGETGRLLRDDGDVEEEEEEEGAEARLAGGRGSTTAHPGRCSVVAPFSGHAHAAPAEAGEGGGAEGKGRGGGRVRDSCGYWDSDSSSSADYGYYHRPYCKTCLQHGARHPDSASSGSDSSSSDSEEGVFPSLWRSAHPVVNFKEDLQPTFV